MPGLNCYDLFTASITRLRTNPAIYFLLKELMVRKKDDWWYELTIKQTYAQILVLFEG